MDESANRRFETARLYGVIDAHRFLMEQLWAMLLMADADPLTACEATRRSLQDKRPQGSPGRDPDMAYAVMQASADEIDRTFDAVARHLRSAAGA